MAAMEETRLRRVDMVVLVETVVPEGMLVVEESTSRMER
jgi:hypothetical protein